MNSSRQRTVAATAVSGIALICVVIALSTSSGGGTQVADSTIPVDPVTTVPAETISPSTEASVVVAPEQGTDEPCSLRAKTLNGGSSGDDVICLQKALIEAGYLSGTPGGGGVVVHAAAVTKLQTDRELFVDGVTGRETAISLGIWPEEPDLVVRTPPPVPGAVDLLGFPLSSVATSGPESPPLPENSGSGRRLVYQRAGQRVWAVDENEIVIRSWLVSGSKYDNELPGVHEVYSRSETSIAWDGKAYFNLMVRWLKTSDDAIGFHALPIKVADNSLYQTEAELGQRLSGGCQRQANLDAEFTWEFAQVGTPVVVL